jgi:RNA polymerase sigma-70 factor, ECF subfamily
VGRTGSRRVVAANSLSTVEASATDAWAQTRAELVQFVSRRVEHVEAAEDIVQDVLERLYRADLAEVANVQAWLYRASRNAVVDHYRKRRPTVSLDALFHGDSAWSPDQDTQFNVVVESGATSVPQELARCLRPMVEQLPDAYRSAVT